MKKIALSKLKAYEKCLLARSIDRTIEDMDISHLSPVVTKTPVKNGIFIAGVGDYMHSIVGLGSTSELAGIHLTRQLEKTLGSNPTFQKKPWVVEFPLKDYLEHVKDRYGEKCANLVRHYLSNGNSYTGWQIHATYEAQTLGIDEEAEDED